MARWPRVVVVDVAHHVTQRGNARQAILSEEAERVAYLELLRQYSALHRLGLLGYCLMSNHVHLIDCLSLTGVAHEPSIVIEQVSPYSFRFPELSQPI